MILPLLFRRLNFFVSNLDQNTHITQYEHADYGYDLGFLIYRVVLAQESFDCVHTWWAIIKTPSWNSTSIRHWMSLAQVSAGGR